MSRDDGIYTLVASNNTRGRFALDEPGGPEISSGSVIEIQLGGQWIPGSIEHMTECYPGQSLTRLFQPASELGPAIVHGYYFIASKGGICGLCIGQKVRIR